MTNDLSRASRRRASNLSRDVDAELRKLLDVCSQLAQVMHHVELQAQQGKPHPDGVYAPVERAASLVSVAGSPIGKQSVRIAGLKVPSEVCWTFLRGVDRLADLQQRITAEHGYDCDLSTLGEGGSDATDNG